SCSGGGSRPGPTGPANSRRSAYADPRSRVARRARLGHPAGLFTRRAVLTNLVNLGLGVGGALLIRDQVFWRAPDPVISDGPMDWLGFAEPRYATVTVPATVNGVEVMALVDSGAERSVIQRDLARELG